MIVTSASFKGGVGKTTSAIHLAALLSLHGTTLLIDGDPKTKIAWGDYKALVQEVIK